MHYNFEANIFVEEFQNNAKALQEAEIYEIIVPKWKA